MLVPLFHGLSPLDLVRSRAAGQAGYPFDARERMYFYRARNAIYYLFLELVRRRGRLTVLVPDYNSGNEVMAMRAAGASIEYCPIDRSMQMNPDDVERLCDRHRPDVLYVIHYAGWPQPISALVDLCRRRNIWLVEDCALSLLSESGGRALGSFGDWSVFCLYKTLPVPNGAILVQNTEAEEPIPIAPLTSAGLPSAIARTAELLVQRARLRARPVGAALSAIKRIAGRMAGALDIERANVGDIGFELEQTGLAMADVSRRILDRLDCADIRRRRVANYRTLSAQLSDRVSRPLPEPDPGVCPLFFPILVPDKPAAVAALRAHRIEALEFWNDSCEPAGWEMSPNARFLRRHVLELPLHQDLTARHMTYMAERVARLNLRMSDASRGILAA